MLIIINRKNAKTVSLIVIQISIKFKWETLQAAAFN